jgi:DNA repair protein RecN (Recombination protein N)
VLRTLSIRNLVLTDALDITFGDGLNVITGETGAGKSVVLESLGFVLGWQNRALKLRPRGRAGRGSGRIRARSDAASFQISSGCRRCRPAMSCSCDGR